MIAQQIAKRIHHLFLIPVFSICIPFFANAQLCTGSLGDPVVNITFGQGNNFGAPLPAATTNYLYVADACPVNGYYTLLSRCVECNYQWHVLQQDHTGNTNGYFMLVDASVEAGDFYLDTVNNLCANTTYEFAAWMLNMKYVTQGSKPNITFTIETTGGTILKSYNSGDIPAQTEALWKQYGFFFSTPLNISAIVLRMRNNAPGGDGNDLALDDITFRPCGEKITASIDGPVISPVNLCEDDKEAFTLKGSVASSYISPVYQWQKSTDNGTSWKDMPGETNDYFIRQPTAPGNYLYRLTVARAAEAAYNQCRIASNAIAINIHPYPVVNAGQDRVMIVGNPVVLNASASGDSLLLTWSPADYINDTRTLQPIVSPVKDITYTLSATSIFGCSGSDAVKVKVVKSLYIPAAFTPNGDGKNDTWKIPFLDAAIGARVTVFNRYGKVVYKAAGQTVAWDGTTGGRPQPAGTYVYMVTFKNNNTLKGNLTLIR